jgi:hypothetical protein
MSPPRWAGSCRVTVDRPARTGRARGPKDALVARLERNAIRERVSRISRSYHRAALCADPWASCGLRNRAQAFL